jgi:hypothetical protein
MMLAMSQPGRRSCAIRIWGLAYHRLFLALGIAVRVCGWEEVRVFFWLGFSRVDRIRRCWDNEHGICGNPASRDYAR